MLTYAAPEELSAYSTHKEELACVVLLFNLDAGPWHRMHVYCLLRASIGMRLVRLFVGSRVHLCQ